MHYLGGERWKTDGNILGSTWMRCAVLNPFARGRDDRLVCCHFEGSALMGHAQRAFNHERELVEFRCLTRFHPAFRAAHTRDAQAGIVSVHTPYEFLDEL